MDLRAYYQKVNEIEAAMPSPHTLVVSMDTADGGKAGVVTEVPTPIAARMVVEQTARQATEAEIVAFHEKQAAAREVVENAAAASRVQVVVVPATITPAKPPARGGKE